MMGISEQLRREKHNNGLCGSGCRYCEDEGRLDSGGSRDEAERFIVRCAESKRRAAQDSMAWPAEATRYLAEAEMLDLAAAALRSRSERVEIEPSGWLVTYKNALGRNMTKLVAYDGTEYEPEQGEHAKPLFLESALSGKE